MKSGRKHAYSHLQQQQEFPYTITHPCQQELELGWQHVGQMREIEGKHPQQPEPSQRGAEVRDDLHGTRWVALASERAGERRRERQDQWTIQTQHLHWPKLLRKEAGLQALVRDEEPAEDKQRDGAEEWLCHTLWQRSAARAALSQQAYTYSFTSIYRIRRPLWRPCAPQGRGWRKRRPPMRWTVAALTVRPR